MKAHIIMHESFEAPAAIEDWCNSNAVDISFTRFYAGDKLPENTDGFDCLFIMGGPQCPDTTTSESPHFNSKSEIEFISKAINNDKFVLGVCLGAQLIGEALGAKFEHSPHKEIGVYDICLTEEGKKDTIFSKLPQRFSVGHWHGDMPGLTKESKVLAYSKGCPRQIVRYLPKVYGFQCHFEFTSDAIEGMIQNCTEELEKYKSLPFVQNPEKLRAYNYKDMNKFLFRFLDHMKSVFDNDNVKTLKANC